MTIFYLAVSFLASLAGAICGIGGGVIIKPVLDLFGSDPIATVNFLSGCTVLSMSCYSVGRSLLSSDSQIDLKSGTPLALGAAVGGLGGKQLFQLLQRLAGETAWLSAGQSLCLVALNLCTLAYVRRKASVASRQVDSKAVCALIGFALGTLSSFLGIGGGPFNLVVLHYFFSMDSKRAAQNSLYIICLSQATSLLTTLATRAVPPFSGSSLAVMIAGGILGGILGRRVLQKLEAAAVDRLFAILIVVITAICAGNVVRVLL